MVIQIVVILTTETQKYSESQKGDHAFSRNYRGEMI